MDLAAAIMRDRWMRHFVLPHYTPSGWWECDIFEITSAGFFREYEVKVSRPDFFKDSAKHKRRWERVAGKWQEVEGSRKHDLLEAKSTKGPVQFWFVTPVGLVALSEVPEWAGLFEVAESARGIAQMHEIKPAPRLHNEKLPAATREHAESICYWRFHRMRIEMARRR